MAPIYTHQCPSCGNTESQLTYRTGFAPRICDECGQLMHYVYSAANLKFKGTGWETNDYKPKKEDSPND